MLEETRSSARNSIGKASGIGWPARCGPACRVVWQGCGSIASYADFDVPHGDRAVAGDGGPGLPEGTPRVPGGRPEGDKRNMAFLLS